MVSLTKLSLARVSWVVPDLDTRIKRVLSKSTVPRMALASSGSTLEINFAWSLSSFWCLFEPALQGARYIALGTQVRTADTDLHHRVKGLAGAAFDFTGMHLTGKLRHFGLLPGVEGPQVFTLELDRAQLLPAGELVEDLTVLPGVHDFSGEDHLVLSDQLLLISELLQGQRESLGLTFLAA
jgi:hypothetical protein